VETGKSVNGGREQHPAYPFFSMRRRSVNGSLTGTRRSASFPITSTSRSVPAGGFTIWSAIRLINF